MRIFITGTAGFIGYHLAEQLLAAGHSVSGYDALTDYYDPSLKADRESRLRRHPGFSTTAARLEDSDALERAVAAAAPEIIVHLAAQAGVRHSLDNPRAYLQSNIVGSFNLLEAARKARPRHLLLASTSSVYGANPTLPSAESDPTDHPLTLYAASKKSMESMAHSSAHLWSLPTTCMRLFTVYGPWGRPDMAPFAFVSSILAGRRIDIYGDGDMARDFTYVDDVVAAIGKLIVVPPALGQPAGGSDSLSPAAPWRVVNLGGGRPVALLDFVAAIEKAVGRPAIRRLLPMQKGDVRRTAADTKVLRGLIGDVPETPIESGVAAFVAWYRDYYRV